MQHRVHRAASRRGSRGRKGLRPLPLPHGPRTTKKTFVRCILSQLDHHTCSLETPGSNAKSACKAPALRGLPTFFLVLQLLNPPPVELWDPSRVPCWLRPWTPRCPLNLSPGGASRGCLRTFASPLDQATRWRRTQRRRSNT